MSARERLRLLRDDESGFTLTELLVGMMVGMIVIFGIYSIITVTTNGSERITGEVEAAQRARPALNKVMDRLHSSCVATEIAPVQAGSGDYSLRILHKTGSAVTLTPDLRVISLSGGILSETVYPATGGSAPTWTFSSSPSSTDRILDRVEAAKLGSPAVTVPLFQYFAYVPGSSTTTKLTTPLTAADAERAVLVKVAFATGSVTTHETDKNATKVNVTDEASLRLSPAINGAAEKNVPCA